MASAADDPGTSTLEVYWRPGCGYCDRLFRALRAAGITPITHNIWDDPEARQFVRSHNRGNETVPTVTLGGVTSTNPNPKELIDDLRASHPHLIGEAAPSRNPLHRLGRRP